MNLQLVFFYFFYVVPHGPPPKPCDYPPRSTHTQHGMSYLSEPEKKASAVRFLKQRWPAIIGGKHLFAENNTLAEGAGYCHTHQQTCVVPDARVDITVAGLPCKAFSKLREKSGKS
eukprot:2668054-Amphidinium_carterae.2